MVVDDHPMFRQGMIAALSAVDIDVVGEAGDATTALEIANTIAIDVAVIDVLMPATSGISLTLMLRERQPACRVLGLSVIDDVGLVADMLRAGACGFAIKTQPIDEIVGAVRLALANIQYLPPGMSAAAVDRSRVARTTSPLRRLTRREREVFELVIRGQSNDEISTRLVISRRTVETHRQRIANKLSAHSLVQLQRIAAVHGWRGQ